MAYPKMKSRIKDIRAKHRIAEKYPSERVLDEGTLLKAIAEADQKVRKKKQLTSQMLLTALEDGRHVRFEGAVCIINEGNDRRLVKVGWGTGKVEAMFSCWKENGVWYGKRVGLFGGE